MEAICNVPQRKVELEMQLCKDNGLARFAALFNANGTLVPTKRVGSSWAILANGTIVAWFSASQARKPLVRLRHDRAKGYYVGVILARAKIVVLGSTPTTQRVAMVRADNDVVEIIDNGRQTTDKL